MPLGIGNEILSKNDNLYHFSPHTSLHSIQIFYIYLELFGIKELM